jgi:hypothetical protein
MKEEGLLVDSGAVATHAGPAEGRGSGSRRPLALRSRRSPFTLKGLVILGIVAALEAAAFMVFIHYARGGRVEAYGKSLEREAAALRDCNLDEYLEVGRAILDVGEIKVPVTSTQPRAPKSISATFQVVVSQGLLDKLSGGTAGRGGTARSNPQRDVLVLNVRSILRGMMDSDGVRLIEPAAKGEFERRAKDRLNIGLIDGDQEKAQVLKVLRNQVLQVIIDKFDMQTY